MEFYDEKNKVYFTNPRLDLIRLIPKRSDNKVLEIGAGGGDTLVEVKKQKLASKVVGIELMTMANSNQTNPDIDQFIICDVEKTNFDFPESYFDVILLGDVVEHLLDPWSFVEKISRIIKKDGVIIASIPNIRYYTACIRIVFKGNFGYESQGLFDKTHFRFFCKKNMRDLFNSPYLKCEDIIPRQNLYKIRSMKKFLTRITFGLLEEFFTMQYIIVAKKV